MKKTRLLSLMLAVLMTASCVFFSGCGEETEEKQGGTANTSTREVIALNMYIITEDTTTQEEADKVEMALNRVLLPNHKTLVNMNYLTEAEYWDTIEAVMEETDPAKSQSLTIDRAVIKGMENMSFTEMTEFIFDEEKTSVELSKPQIDILVVNDFDKYTQLSNDGKLKGLNSFLTYDSKILNTNIHPTLMAAAKVGTETYGIPTNIGVEAGEYTYLVFNEDLLKKYGYTVKDLRVYSSVDFSEYLGKIKAGEPGVWPVSGPCEIAGAEYHDGAFISVNSQFNYIASDARPLFMYNLYNSNQSAIEKYRNLGYFPAEGTAGQNAKYAIKIEKSKELLSKDEDKRWTDETGTTYVRLLYDIPRVEIDEIFTSVMCVSATSPEPERAMELITIFQTDSELANLLQYGVEGEHYQINQVTGDYASLTDAYAMDNYITGNTYINYNAENNKKYLEEAIAANLNVAPSAYLGFNLNVSGVDRSRYELVKNINVAGTEEVAAGRAYDEIRKIVSREMLNCGYDTDSSGNVMGIFGTVQQAQSANSAAIEAGFGLGQEVLTYNEPYGIYIGKRPIVVKTEEATEGAEEGEVSETAEGEAAEGEAETAEGEAEAAEGENEAAESEAVEAQEGAEAAAE